MRYVLFAKESCPFCVKAEHLLQKQEKEYKLVNFEKDQESVLQEIKEAYKWPTVPMIFKVGDDKLITFVGGYTDLIEHFEGE
tara:strand:- start:835 stop:1080 length:246 start_codon:yes stop_codon:yes gene_type:complete